MFASAQPAWAQNQLSNLIEQARMNDANQHQISAQAQALRETGIASATLMDPKLKMGIGGVPVDSFGLDDDPMTNISVGLMQQFERGDTLKLQQRKMNQQAEGIALQGRVRELEVANNVTQLWAELYFQQQSELLIRKNRALMQDLVAFIETNYALGKSQAQDLLQAQLQVSKLDEKLQANKQVQQRIQSQLSEWLGEVAFTLQSDGVHDWVKLEAVLENQKGNTNYYSVLGFHPTVLIADALIKANQTQVDIAKQAYEPQFGVEVMYGYRQADGMMGQPASDLVSVFLTMDLPFFTDKRQDKQYSAAQYQVGAAQSQRDLLLTQMNAKVNTLLVDKANTEQRLSRYQHTLLKQAKQRTQAVERGYENNTAQFSEFITAASEELALAVEQARLQADLNITKSNLAFWLDGFAYTSAGHSSQ